MKEPNAETLTDEKNLATIVKRRRRFCCCNAVRLTFFFWLAVVVGLSGAEAQNEDVKMIVENVKRTEYGRVFLQKYSESDLEKMILFSRDMTPSSQGIEPPAIPGRFRPCQFGTPVPVPLSRRA